MASETINPFNAGADVAPAAEPAGRSGLHVGDLSAEVTSFSLMQTTRDSESKICGCQKHCCVKFCVGWNIGTNIFSFAVILVLLFATNVFSDVGGGPPSRLCQSVESQYTIVRDVQTLTVAERDAIVAAVHKMKTVPSKYDQTLSAYDYFVTTHATATAPNTEVHAGWYFYPWHRALMWRFTSELRRVTGDKDIAFPYWNWADSNSTSVLLDINYLGPRTGLKQDGYVLKEGNFAQGKWPIHLMPPLSLPGEVQSGALLRAQGNGVQMCFDDSTPPKSYVLDTPYNPRDVDHQKIVGPFRYLPGDGPPAADVLYLSPRASNLQSNCSSWESLTCNRYYDSLTPNTPKTTLRCQHFATTMPSQKDYDRCQSLPNYTTKDGSKLGLLDPKNPFATTKDYSNSFVATFRACFEGIDPSEPIAKGLERLGASLHPPHGATHTFMGGSLATPTSPNDPIFTHLHWNVDRKFAEWQKEHGNEWFTDGPMKDMLDKPMPVLDNPKVTLRDVLEHHKMGFTFDTVC